MPLPPGERHRLCRRRRSSPGGTPPAGGSRGPAGRPPRPWPAPQPGGPGPARRGLRWSASRHLLGGLRDGWRGRSCRVAERSGERGQDSRAPPGRCAPRLPWSPATRCRSTLRPRPGRAGWCAGPAAARAVPGAARKVAARSLVTIESTSTGAGGAGAAAGPARPSTTDQVAGWRPRSSSAADSETARYCGRRVRARTSETGRPVRSKTHWTGRANARHQRPAGDLPVEDQVDVDDGRRPEIGQPVLVGHAAGRQQGPAASWGTATITASATSCSAPVGP